MEHVNQPQNQCGFQNNASISTEAGNWYYIFASTLEAYANVTIESMVLGVSENELEGFVYYPNPVTDVINISAKSTIDDIVVYNIMGQKVYSEKIGMASSRINLGHLSPGLYVMNVSSEGKSATYKIVKK